MISKTESQANNSIEQSIGRNHLSRASILFLVCCVVYIFINFGNQTIADEIDIPTVLAETPDDSDNDNQILSVAALISKGDVQAAILSLSSLARAGNAKAAVILARMYRQGFYVAPSEDLNCKYAALADELGDPDGAYELGICLADEDQSMSFFQSALAKGSLNAKKDFSCGGLDVVDSLSEEDWLRLYRLKSSSNNPYDIVEAADLAWLGCDAGKYASDEYEVKALYMRAAKLGLPQGYAALGSLAHWKGDLKNAERYFKLAFASNFHRSAIHLVYNAAVSGLQAPISAKMVERAKFSFEMAKPWVESDACFFGDIYRLGVEILEVEKNESLAVSYYKECLSGDFFGAATAANWLGVMYSNGVGVAQNHVVALEYFSKAHELGDPYASSNIGEAYELGEGFEVDYQEAFKWYKISFELLKETSHFGWGSYHLGRFYENGMGVDQNYNRAAFYYRKAIETTPEASPMPYIRLGDLIAQGHIQGNKEEALELYGKATKSFPEYENLTVGEHGKTYQKLAENKVRNLEKKQAHNENAKAYLEPGIYHALLFGVQDYVTLTDLKTPINDVRDLEQVLASRYGFSTTVVENPTRRQILQNISVLRKTLGPKDNLLIYYAGHGHLDLDTDSGFWQAVDADPVDDLDWIPTERITSTLRAIKSNNILVIADSCFSGTLLRGGAVGVESSGELDAIQRLIEEKTRVAFTSGGLAPVADNLLGARNSLFANELITMLQRTTEPLPATELFSQVRTRVISVSNALGFEQSPQFSNLTRSGHEGGDFVFVQNR